MKCEEIFAALEMLEKERGIPQDFMMGKIIRRSFFSSLTSTMTFSTPSWSFL